MKKMLVQGDTPFIPDEIITNILKRLPVKILIRFQCVCKHWKNLIKSRSFIADHLHHPSNQNPRLLFKRHGDDPLNLFVVDCETQAHLDVQKPPFASKLCHASIIGSCNGLICVRSASYASSGTSLFIWNPATREVRWVPGVIGDGVDGVFYFGFGFSPILNDYRIVKIFKRRVVKRVEVYSLNTDSWREIEFGNTEGVIAFRGNASVNGSIFWCVSRVGAEREIIVSFDIAREAFTSMSIPSLGINSFLLRVFEHNKKPVAVRFTGMGKYESDYHFWAMEEAVDASGKNWSWTKIDNSSSCLSNLSTTQAKIENIGGRCGAEHVLFFVESLVPVVSCDSQSQIHREEHRS